MKKHAKWIFPILLTGLLLLSACQPANQVVESGVSPEESQMKPDVPAIDQTQPDDFATATFSMG